MTGTMKSAAMALGTGVALFAIADVFASFLSWRGAPTDMTWEPSFWKYEVWRLSYWLTFALIAAALSFAVVYIFSRYPPFVQRHFPSTTITAAVLFCISAFGTEYTTSIRFWQSVPHDEAVLLWISERLYIREHLESWLFAIAVILPASLYWQWRRTRRSATGEGAEHS